MRGSDKARAEQLLAACPVGPTCKLKEALDRVNEWLESDAVTTGDIEAMMGYLRCTLDKLPRRIVKRKLGKG